ncbi:MAG TPA: hypothetical protein VEV38_07950 [Candidatus Eremiobacteraceae bacterium]|nr:hypothetical protein [Candidatus Eremiobacteraceae bacterium]
MTHLNRSRELHCPWVRAIAYFDSYLAGLPDSERAQGHDLRLRAPLDSIGASSDLAIDRDVVASFTPLDDPKGLEHGISIGWVPVGAVALPSFQGSLRIVASTPKSSTLVLDGDYEPPLGALGKLFDAAIGRRIAEATGDELLKTIAEQIELAWVTDEPHISR